MARAFDVCTLKLYTAGNSGANLRVPGMDVERAKRLRQQLDERVSHPNPAEGIPEPQAVYFPARRQHPTGVFQYIVKYVWVFIRGFWPILAGAAVSDNIRAYGEWIGLAVLIIACLSAVMQYWKFTFQVTEDALIIRRGVLERERVTITFERIQMVNLEQSIWQRAFGVMSVKVDTAGTSGAEVEIAALKVKDANALKAVLSGGGALPSASVHTAAESNSGGEHLIALSWDRLFKVGFTQNHLRNALIAFGSIVALAEPLEGVLSDWLSDVPTYTWFVLKFLWVLLIPIFTMGVVVVGVLVSLIGAVLRYYNLQVRAQADGLELSGGLLKKFEFKIPLHKVQLCWKVVAAYCSDGWVSRRTRSTKPELNRMRQKGG